MQAMEPDRTIRVNRDDTRRRLFGSDDQDYYQCGKDVLNRKEDLVTEANRQAILTALKAGMDVIVDDTNLPVKRCRELIRLAKAAGAEWKVEVFDTPLEECLLRNANRTDKQPVPEEVILRMHTQFFNPTLSPVPDDAPEMVYHNIERNLQLPKTIIVDTDGTLANHSPHRSPYDTSRYSEDTLYHDVADVVKALSQTFVVIGVSGRSDEFREVTLDWWRDVAGINPGAFFMRAKGDTRNDAVVKSEIYEGSIRTRYNVIGVIDDRPRVCNMWRDLGLTTFQVGDPNNDF